jgi:hypothetical protein
VTVAIGFESAFLLEHVSGGLPGENPNDEAESLVDVRMLIAS